uniref:Uncharacterized protein n=1 Tax=Lactuca sativa TaxID=4236 RepID=A0A9R1VVY6_LACSA|nr:hypothetical protein LSAT_V11C400168840 [Lactuca sativa]
MFVVVIINGNTHTLPIAFETLRQSREVSFITNMDDVISSFIDMYSLILIMGILLKYTRTRCISSRTLQLLFLITSNSYTVTDFEENFRRLIPDACEVLANIGYAKWARAYFPNIHWNVVNIDVRQNFVFTVNQRNVLIIMLTEAIRDNIQ